MNEESIGRWLRRIGQVGNRGRVQSAHRYEIAARAVVADRHAMYNGTALKPCRPAGN